MIKKKYLTEVAFKDGVEEFRSYRSYTVPVIVNILDETTTSYRVQLVNEEIDKESLTVEIKDRYEIALRWRKVNGSEDTLFEIYTEGTDVIAKGEVIEINYIALNTYSSDLYSVDYDTGTLYLAYKPNIDLVCNCEFYNVLLTGKAAEQLGEDDYSLTAGALQLKNIVETYSYSSLYNRIITGDIEYTTPFIKNIRVNYINTTEEESL